jgi:hypothetical protein
VIASYWAAFLELIGTPFQQIQMIWGVVPLYFALLLHFGLMPVRNRK